MNSDLIDSSDPLSPTAPAAAPPPRLGEYRLLREIGRGGMGVVYEAVQESLGRHVALKVLPAGLAGRGSFLERFRREARVAGRLHHTNIVAVYGVGEQNGSHFYAMQFIRGQGLDAVLQDVRRLRGLDPAANAAPTSLRNASAGHPTTESPPPTDVTGPAGGREELVGPSGAAYYRGAARLARQAAEALAYAHGQGVLHRDVKPSNLLIDWQGAVWITDFGLAKADDAPDLTAPDDPVGTLRYMAPERFQGRADARSDVYSLGATLHEILTLRPLFDDDDRMRLIARITQEAPPRKSATDLPRDLETIVLKATARDPADRYVTAAELADDLRRFLEDRPIAARRASLLERLRRWRRRNPAVAALAFSVVGLLLLLAVGSTAAALWLGWQRSEVGRANAALEDANARLGATNGDLTAANGKLIQNKTDLETANHNRDAAITEKTEKLWASLYQQARAGRFGQRPGRRIDSLTALVEARRIRPDDRLRTEAIACLTLTDLKPGREWNGWPDGAFAVDFDDKLECCARADRQGAVSVRRTGDDAEIAHFTTGFNGPASVTLSPDGRFAAVRADGDSGRLQVWEVGDTPERRIDEPAGVAAVAFSADSRRLAVVRADGDTDIDDPSNGQNLIQLQTGPRSRAAAFRPDGRRLAVACETAVGFYDPQTGKRVGEWPTRFDHLPAMEALAWRPDGALLAAVGRGGPICFWDPATGKLKATTPEPLAANVRIAFDHAGDLLASRDASEVLRLWDPRTGRQLFAAPSDTRALRFSPDDRRLAAEIDGHKLRIWEVAAGREYRTLTAEAAAHDAPEFSGGAAIRRDGRLLAAAMSDGVRLWDLATGEQCVWLPDKDGTAAVAFDGDGALLTHGTEMEAAVVRWPIQADPDHADALRIGPREALPLRGGGAGLACSADGRVTAVATLRGVQVQGPDHAAKPIDLQLREDSGDDVRDVAVSSDGRWVAACSHGTKGVRVWDVRNGVVALEIPGEEPAVAVFSPDGQWLAAGGKEDCQVWAVGSWDKGLRIEGAASAFSPDGAMLAVETGRGIVRLVDPQTGKCYAQLEDPNQDRSDVYFTPGGAQLAAVSLEGRCIHVWDLRRIRQGLAEIGLDWERPAYPAAAAAGPLRVTIVGASP